MNELNSVFDLPSMDEEAVTKAIERDNQLRAIEERMKKLKELMEKM